MKRAFVDWLEGEKVFDMNNYIFPFQLIQHDSRIILYGAGNVGKIFNTQLKITKYAEVVAWVDKNYKQYQELGMDVIGLEAISKKEFDYIVISIDNVHIAADVMDVLNKDFGIDRSKIIHSENYRYTEDTHPVNIYKLGKWKDSEAFIQINPKDLLSKNRLDLCVRYLLSKDILNGIKNDKTMSLYSRMILSRSNALEEEGFFNEYKREGTREYICAVKKLCESIRQKGFDKDKFIPVGDNEIFLNGAHRIATAMALEEKIWVKHFDGQNGATNFGMKWFEENGFNCEDKIRILRAFADLYRNCGIMLFFGPCIDQWDYLQAQLAKQMTIVGTVELDFSDNYIAFENLFREIYSDPLWRNVYIDRKIELLKMSPLKIRLLLVSDEDFKEHDLYKTMSKAKLELRDRMYFDTDIAPVVMHGSDGHEEFIHLKQILLSVNNMKHLRMRVTRNYRDVMIENIDRLKEKLKKIGVPQTECVCTGSSGFEIFGLRKAHDLDVAFSSNYREKYGDRTIYEWLENIDYVRKDSIQVSDDVIYPDDLIISDDNLYYMFYGMKFVNIELITQKKAYNRRENDIRDVRLYELFRDYVANFDDKSYLKSQIEREFYKKR